MLWAVLHNLGVRADFLRCLQSTYAQDSAAVRAGGAVSQTFRCLQGVQQGSPLSPLLYGLITDVLDKVMCNLKGSHAAQLKAEDVALLLFASDLVLMNTGKEGLQQLLNALQMVFQKRRLKVSLSKTEGVVFEPECQACGVFTYARHVLTRSAAFTYLGLWFEATTDGFAKSLGESLETARKVLNDMLRHCCLTCLHSICSCNLFDALVLPN